MRQLLKFGPFRDWQDGHSDRTWCSDSPYHKIRHVCRHRHSQDHFSGEHLKNKTGKFLSEEYRRSLKFDNYLLGHPLGIHITLLWWLLFSDQGSAQWYGTDGIPVQVYLRRYPALHDIPQGKAFIIIILLL